MKCPNCGQKNPKNALFCVECGQKFENKLTCSKCGYENDVGAAFCAKCGTSLNPRDKRTPTKKTQKLSIKPVWLILGSILLLLIIGVYFLFFHVPKTCRPLVDALETNQEFTYGCSPSICHLWLQNMEGFDDLQIVFQWGESEAQNSSCYPDPESNSGTRCDLSFPSDGEYDLHINMRSGDCLWYFTTLSSEEIKSVLPDPNTAPTTYSSDPDLCGDFQNAVANQSGINVAYDPLGVNLWTITMSGVETLGIRYEWVNERSGTGFCGLIQEGEFSCTFPAEMGQSQVKTWLNDGECEAEFYTFTEAEINWNMDEFSTCNTDFVDALKATVKDWYFTYDPDDLMADLFVYHIPGITQFEGTTMYFYVNDAEVPEPADRCIIDEEAGEIKCYIMLGDKPDVVSVVIDNNGCQVFAEGVNIQQIDEYLNEVQTN